MSKLRKSAKGQDCEMRLYPYCTGESESVVLAHLHSEDKGMGNKSPDWWAVYACATCHDIIDGRLKHDLESHELVQLQMRALYRTQRSMIQQGLIKA